MSLENLVGPDKFLSALVPANPTGGDDKREGDDHIRGIKNVLLNSFPNVNAAVTATDEELSSVVGKVNRSGDNMTGPLAVNGPLSAPGANGITSRILEGGGHGLQLEGYIGENVGSALKVWRASMNVNEADTYAFGLNITQVGDGLGYPMARYDWAVNQYQGFNGYSCSIGAGSGQWTFAVAIGNGSDERRKSNWSGLAGDYVSRLAGVKSGTYDYAAGGIVSRGVGVGAQHLREVLPEAVNEDADGWLSVQYGNAALVSAVELARVLVSLRAEVAALRGEVDAWRAKGAGA